MYKHPMQRKASLGGWLHFDSLQFSDRFHLPCNLLSCQD